LELSAAKALSLKYTGWKQRVSDRPLIAHHKYFSLRPTLVSGNTKTPTENASKANSPTMLTTATLVPCFVSVEQQVSYKTMPEQGSKAKFSILTPVVLIVIRWLRSYSEGFGSLNRVQAQGQEKQETMYVNELVVFFVYKNPIHVPLLPFISEAKILADHRVRSHARWYIINSTSAFLDASEENRNLPPANHITKRLMKKISQKRVEAAAGRKRIR
jgi:hypothetical protein